VASILPKVKHAKKIEKELHINCLPVVGECGWFSVCAQVLLESISFNPKMVAPSKWLELGIDLLKKNR